MEIKEYFSTKYQAHWLEEIRQSDWSAGQFLYELLSKNEIHEFCGNHVRLFLLTEGKSWSHSAPYQTSMTSKIQTLVPGSDLSIPSRSTEATGIWDFFWIMRAGLQRGRRRSSVHRYRRNRAV